MADQPPPDYTRSAAGPAPQQDGANPPAEARDLLTISPPPPYQPPGQADPPPETGDPPTISPPPYQPPGQPYPPPEAGDPPTISLPPYQPPGQTYPPPEAGDPPTISLPPYQPLGQPYSLQQNVTFIAAQPEPIIIFRENPVTLVCPFCQSCIQTEVRYDNGNTIWLWMILFCLIGGLLCFWIPLVMYSFKGVEHYCPNCRRVVGTFRR